MIFKKLLPYRILKIYISYKHGVSTIINKFSIICPKNIDYLYIISIITNSIQKSQSPSKAISELEKLNEISVISINKKYRKYDIVIYFKRFSDIDISRYCKFKNDKRYIVINDIICKI